MTGKQLLGTVKEIRKAQEKQRKQQEANDKKAKDIAYAQLNNVMPKLETVPIMSQFNEVSV